MKLLKRIQHFLTREDFDSGLAEEMKLHIELRQEDLERQGLSKQEARIAARREFGNPLLTLEDSRSAWSWRWLEDAWADLRYAWRGFRRNPGFTAVAMLCMALGIGANTAVFSLLNGAFLRPQAVPEPERIYQLEMRQKGSSDSWAVSYPVYEEIADAQKSLQAFAPIGETKVRRVRINNQNIAGDWRTAFAGGQYFDVFPVTPLLGRTIRPADDVPNAAAYPVVLSYQAWMKYFDGDRNVVGKPVRIEAGDFEVAGVLPPGFDGVGPGLNIDLWAPIHSYPHAGLGANLASRDVVWFQVVGRLAPSIAHTLAEAELSGIIQTAVANDRRIRNAEERVPAPKDHYAVLKPAPGGLDYQARHFEKPLYVLFGLVAAMLLMAVANVGGLLLARTAARQREIAVRNAIGAGALRLCRQMLVESLVLAVAGACIGVTLSRPACNWILSLLNTQASQFDFNYSLDLRVLAFTTAVTLIATLLFGLAPMIWSLRVQVAPSLAAGARTHSPGQSIRLFGRAIVVAQIALATLLVGGSLLLMGSLRALQQQNPGFTREGILTAYLYPGDLFFGPEAKPFRVKQNNYYEPLQQKLRALPGVSSVALTEFPPLSGYAMRGPVTIEQTGRTTSEGALFQPVSAGYFETLRMPLLAGRTITETDTATSPKVVVVDERLASIISPGASPIGKRVSLDKKFNPESSFEIVGVVKASKFINVRDTPKPILYRALTQSVRPFYTAIVRTSGNPADLAPAVRGILEQTETTIPVDRITPLTALYSDSINRERMLGWLSGVFALLALLLAAIGTYGLVSNQLVRRVPEIGIRLALGAGRSDIARLVLEETAVLLLLGLAAGIPMALYAGRLMQSQLFGLKPSDPSVLALTVSAIALAAALALLIPARKALRVDPAQALRQE